MWPGGERERATEKGVDGEAQKGRVKKKKWITGEKVYRRERGGNDMIVLGRGVATTPETKPMVWRKGWERE